MTDKEVVRTIEPHAFVEKADDGWLVRRHPEGRSLGGGKTPGQAWHAARLNLFGESVRSIVSEILETGKGV
jgi:hypothetical protein